MKILEIAALGGLAYLLIKGAGSSLAETGEMSAFPESSLLPAPIIAGSEIPGIKAISSGKAVPNTTITMSRGFSEKLKNISAADLAKDQAALYNQKISVRSVGAADLTQTQKSSINQVFQKQYISGGFIPSSVLAGKPTKTDLIIAQNIAKQSFK